MLEFLKGWLTSVVMVVMFMVLMNMLLPSTNGFKKYAKFASGLMVIAVIMTPVFKLFDRNISVETYIGAYSEYFDEQGKNVINNDLENIINERTIEIFKDNLKKEIVMTIKSETEKEFVITNIEIDERTSSKGFGEIYYLELKLNGDILIKPIEKINIGNKNNKDAEVNEAENHKDVLKILKSKFNLSSKKVKFIK